MGNQRQRGSELLQCSPQTANLPFYTSMDTRLRLGTSKVSCREPEESSTHQTFSPLAPSEATRTTVRPTLIVKLRKHEVPIDTIRILDSQLRSPINAYRLLSLTGTRAFSDKSQHACETKGRSYVTLPVVMVSPVESRKLRWCQPMVGVQRNPSTLVSQFDTFHWPVCRFHTLIHVMGERHESRVRFNQSSLSPARLWSP